MAIQYICDQCGKAISPLDFVRVPLGALRNDPENPTGKDFCGLCWEAQQGAAALAYSATLGGGSLEGLLEKMIERQKSVED